MSTEINWQDCVKHIAARLRSSELQPILDKLVNEAKSSAEFGMWLFCNDVWFNLYTEEFYDANLEFFENTY